MFSHYVWIFATPWTAAHQAFLFFTISRSFLKLISIESAMPSNHLILCHPLSPFAFNLCLHQGLFQLVAFHIKEPKCESFSFSVSPSNEYSGLISFRIDWFDLLAAQGTLKSLLQHHNLIASILQCSAFFIVQLAHLYLTTGKSTALTILTLSAKYCLCFLICCLVLS